jgi:hypothetical protein
MLSCGGVAGLGGAWCGQSWPVYQVVAMQRVARGRRWEKRSQESRRSRRGRGCRSERNAERHCKGIRYLVAPTVCRRRVSLLNSGRVLAAKRTLWRQRRRLIANEADYEPKGKRAVSCLATTFGAFALRT